MTHSNRPLAVLFAAVMFVSLWVPTLTMPAPAVASQALPAALA